MAIAIARAEKVRIEGDGGRKGNLYVYVHAFTPREFLSGKQTNCKTLNDECF